MTKQEKYAEEYGDFMATWGPNSGAPKAVFAGQLKVLLDAHQRAVEESLKEGKSK